MTERLSQTERRTQTRKRLLAAAGRSFAEHGYSGTSVDAVAELAGYTKGAAYFHFPRKGDMLLALLDDHCNQVLNTIESVFAESASLEARLHHISEFLMGHDDEEDYATLLFFELAIQARRDPELQSKFANLYRDIRDRASNLMEKEAGREGGSLPLASDVLAAAIVGLCDGLALQQMIDPTRSGVDTFQAMLQLILKPISIG